MLGLLKKWWEALPRFHHHLTINLIVGLSIGVLIMAFHDLPWLMETEDAGMDWSMKLYKGIIPSIQDKNIPPLIFWDIDDKTYYAWGEPLFTPRNHLKNLIENAVATKARLVVVDIDVSQATPVEESESSLHSTDQALKSYLEAYVTECKQQNDDSVCPPILFLRAFSAQDNPIPVPRIGFLEEVVEQGAPYLYWASAHFYRAKDQVVRRWMLWQPACTVDKQPTVVPSIELLAMGLIQGCTVEETQKALQPFLPKNCENGYIPLQEPPPETFELCQLKISTNRRGIHQRIRYSIPWLENNEFLETQAGEFIFTNRSAQPYANPLVDLSDIPEKSIVVIGGSYKEGGDIHLTPLDKMPGALIIINAIYSLLDYDTIDPLPILVKLLLIAILIILMNLLFIRFSSFWGMVLVGMVIIFAMLPISIALFHYGIWLDFALPLLIVQIRQIAADFNELRNNPVQQESELHNNELRNNPIQQQS